MSQLKQNTKKLALLAGFLALAFIPGVLSAVGLFLSLWIVVPAPVLFLYPLAVGAPEVSPWLASLNAIALLLGVFRVHESWLYSIPLGCSAIALLLSLLPLLQVNPANTRIAAEMERVLGTDYLAAVPHAVEDRFRPQPFVLGDVFRGIAIAEVRIDRGVVFANPDGVELYLNVYRPMQSGKYPALVVLYSGAWQSGSPDRKEEFSRYMASQGYCVVAIDYRHAPEYHFPAQLEDVQTALSYIHTHADSWEIDRDRIALLGRSAGAHLAMLYAYRSHRVRVQAVVNYYGPTNLIEGYHDPPVPDPLDVRAVLRAFPGGTPEELPAVYQQASPVSYVKPALPPSLLVYAGRDHIVQPKFGRQLYEQLRSTGNRAVWLELPWAEHSFDAVFNGVSNQIALYYTERFLAWALKS